MEIIKLSVEKQVIHRSGNASLVAGEVGVHAVRLSYDAAWDNVASKVICFHGPGGNIAILDNGGDNPIPWEPLQEPGMLEVGVVGYDSAGELVITTRVQAPYGSRFRIYPNTTCEDTLPASLPTPSVWEEVLGSIGQLSDLKTDIKTNLVAAVNEVLSKVSAGGGGGVSFTTDETLSLKNGVLGVNRAFDVEADNTLPITSAAVHTTVGNIEILLSTI